MKKLNGLFGLIAAALLVTLTGCSKDDPVSPDADQIANEDAAESMASSLGQDNGGAADQLADISEIASVMGIQGGTTDLKGSAQLSGGGTIDTTYDPVTGTWTATLSRERGSASGAYYAKVTRVYQYQLRNKDGQPQKHWLAFTPGSGVDTAYSMTFTIVSGTGEHHTPHLSQHLASIAGSWTATGLNTATITINGNYTRSGVDTITTRNAERTLDHTLALAFTNIQIPRGARGEIASRISGTITGTYNATVTFTRGSLYADKTISREFTVTLGQGKANIAINGKTFIGLLGSGMLM